MAETKTQFNRMVQENQGLVTQLETSQKESYDVFEHFRADLLEKTEKIAELEADIIKVSTLEYPQPAAQSAGLGHANFWAEPPPGGEAPNVVELVMSVRVFP